ncbi:MAG: LysM peptidoglycan-binding domain-containing protein [Filifactoraceae bacterium]
MYSLIIDSVLFPISPDKIKTKISGRNKTYTLINDGEINLLKEQGLIEFEFTLEIPFSPGDFRHQGDFKEVKFYLDKLVEMKKPRKKDGTINFFPLVILRDLESSEITVSDTQMNVTLEEYDIDEDVKHGSSLLVNVKFKQYRSHLTKEVVLDTSDNTLSETVNKRPQTLKESYQIQNGDTLVIIAQKELGDSSKWKMLYEINKSEIEKVAKTKGKTDSQNGSWIFPGTILKLR